jgi:hypothetical protein
VKEKTDLKEDDLFERMQELEPSAVESYAAPPATPRGKPLPRRPKR